MMSWKPSEEDIEITREQLESLPTDGFWATPDQHAQYRRDGDQNKLVLVKMLDHPSVEEVHDRVTVVLDLIGWEVENAEDLEIVPAWHPSPEEAMLEERMRMQEQLSKASCSNEDCKTLLASMPLEDVVWAHIDDGVYVDDEEEEHSIEIWSPIVTCHTCSTEISLAPEHYVLLVGDELASTYTNRAGFTYRMLLREEVIATIDSGGSPNLHVLGTFCPYSKEVIPPYYRGLIVTLVEEESDEE